MPLSFPLSFPLTGGSKLTYPLTNKIVLPNVRIGSSGGGSGSSISIGSNASPSFFLPLTDAGAGAVNLTPATASGSPTPTFTRATVAWTKLATGLWTQVASGTARSSFLGADTTVSAYGGYLTEAAATQLVTPTAAIRDMTDASWVKVTMTAAKTATGIDGVGNSASTLTATGATATILQTLVAAASSRTYSVFVRRKTGTGTILLKSGAATLDITALINSVTYTRVQLNDSTLNTLFGIQINTNTDAIEVDFNQFEAGGFATSPMASAGAARSLDLLDFVTAGNISGTTGWAYAEIMTTGLPGQGDIVGSGGGLPLYISSDSKLSLWDSTSERKGNTFTPSGSIQKVASTWGGTTALVSLNGVNSSGLVFDGDLNLGANIGIGQSSGGGASFYGFIRTIKIGTPQLSSAQLQGMTA